MRQRKPQPVELIDFRVNQVRRLTPKDRRRRPHWVGSITASNGETAIVHCAIGSWAIKRDGVLRHLLPSVAEALQARVVKIEKREAREAKRLAEQENA